MAEPHLGLLCELEEEEEEDWEMEEEWRLRKRCWVNSENLRRVEKEDMACSEGESFWEEHWTQTWTSFCFSLQLLFYFSQSVDIRRGGKTRIRTSLLSDTDSYNSVVQTPKPVSIQTHLIVAGLQQP